MEKSLIKIFVGDDLPGVPLWVQTNQKPPPYEYFFCNKKRTAIYFGGAFVVILSPLRTTEITLADFYLA